MKITTTTTILLLGIFACCFANPTTKRPETPIYDDGENEDPFFEEREHPIDEATWALWNQNPNRNCPWWEQHRPGGDYEFSDYPSPLHIERHFAKCLLNHDFGSTSGSGSGSGQSSPQGSQSSSQRGQSRKGSSSSSSVEILDPIDIIRRSQSRSPSIVEVPIIRPGNFEDFYLRQNQEPDFLPNPVSGNEIFVESTPEVIEIFVEDEPSTSTGRRNGKGRPTGRPEACLKKKSNEKDGEPASKKQKIYNMAEGCEVVYIPSGRETPNDVHLVCTSNLGVQQTVAEYQVVDCPSKNNDENDIEMPQTTEAPLPFQVNFEDDDDDDNNGKIRKFNDAFTLAILEATQGQFHNCVQLVELQNKTVGRRQKRLAWFFGPVIALIISAIAIEHEASKIPKCPPNFVIYGKHCIKKGGSSTCPRGFVDLRFLKEPQK